MVSYFKELRAQESFKISDEIRHLKSHLITKVKELKIKSIGKIGPLQELDLKSHRINQGNNQEKQL